MTRVTRAQMLPLLILLVAMFGCKAGEVLKIASVVAVTTVRIAAVAAAVAASQQHHADTLAARAAVESAEAEQRAEENANRPGQCTELFVDTLPPGAPGSPAPARAADCGGAVIYQDEEGHWRSYRHGGVPAIQEP